MNNPIRVGILYVHGIGEQKKFQDIESLVRNLAMALTAQEDLRVRVIVNSTESGAYGASQQTWLANSDREPVIIEVRNRTTDTITELAFREVWWSDLDETVSLKTQLSFWGWGLSLWSRKPYFGKKYATSDQMRLPSNMNAETPKIDLGDRLRFFWVSLVILLIMPLLSLLSVILRQVLGFKLRPDILIQYLGDVKLYQQGKRVGKGPLIDLGQPPRVSIRRRMINGLVQMSLGNYERWYVLSHSLGTLIAFNGLMETDAALANYLNQDLWDKWQQFSSKKAEEEEDKINPDKADNMLPARPAWLNPEDIVDRADLFSKLKGVMTYGSPLSKFAVFWPAIVPINKNTSIFVPGFEWINVYDPTDPVADRTKYFNFTTGDRNQQPIEIAYKAESLHLASHGEYFTCNPKRTHPLVKQVAEWLLTGEKFKPAPTSAGWLNPKGTAINVYVGIRIVIWLILGFLIAAFLSWLFPFCLPDRLEKIITQVPYINLTNPLLYIAVAVVLVIIFGIFVRLFRITFN